MDRYHIPVDPSVNYAKDKLDIFCELLFNFHLLSKALFTTSLDRETCYNAFKGFVDIVRFNDAACSKIIELRTRHETITSVSGRDDSQLTSLLLELLVWRDANFSLSNSAACNRRIRSAYSMAFDILNVLSKSINSELSKLDGAQRLYEARSLKEGSKENVLHPVFIEPKWAIVAEDILKDCSPNVKGVWLAYFHFTIITDNAIEKHLHEVTDAAATIYRDYSLTSPDYYRCPMVITEDMLRALLYSCYTDNPFLYYDCSSEDEYIREKTIMDKIFEPPHGLIFCIARSALSIQPSLIRQNFSNRSQSIRLYRNLLKILRLKIFFVLREIIVPHEQVFDYYKEVFPKDAGWVCELKQDSEQIQNSWSSKRQDVLIRYYPKIRLLIDSMGWVFNSTLSH